PMPVDIEVTPSGAAATVTSSVTFTTAATLGAAAQASPAGPIEVPVTSVKLLELSGQLSFLGAPQTATTTLAVSNAGIATAASLQAAPDADGRYTSWYAAPLDSTATTVAWHVGRGEDPRPSATFDDLEPGLNTRTFDAVY